MYLDQKMHCGHVLMFNNFLQNEDKKPPCASAKQIHAESQTTPDDSGGTEPTN